MATKKRRKRKKKGGLAARAFRLVRFAVLVLLIPLGVGVGIGGFFAFSRSVPSILELKREVAPPGTRIYADDDTLIGEIKIMKGQYATYDRMPEHLINAVVSVEDARFWDHQGIDYLAIMRAAYKDVIKRRLKEGGSTITQQLAKVAFLTPEKTISRKLKELVLAHRIEKDLSKEEIIEVYLNRVYFGQGAYGVQVASKVYFGKSVGDLTLGEAALLAGLLKAPSAYSPLRNFKKAKFRQSIVLRRMEEEGYINRHQLLEAKKAHIYLSKVSIKSDSVNYFLDYIRKIVIKKYGRETVYRGGLSVHTTLDRNMQGIADRAVKLGLRNLDKRRGWRGPIAHRDVEKEIQKARKSLFRSIPPGVGDILEGLVLKVSPKEATVWVAGQSATLGIKDAKWARKSLNEKTQSHIWVQKFNLTKILTRGDVVLVRVKRMSEGRMTLALEQEPLAQGALIALETQSGFIRAMIGGYDYSKSEYNRVLRANRQVGSAFKPVVFTAALERGLTPATIIVDEEISFKDEPDKVWTPKNYDNEYHGPTRLRDALAYSRNVVSVKLVDEIGIDRVIKLSRRLGINSRIPRDLTLALGSLSMTPLEITSAYSVYANNGHMVTPIGIKYITDRSGRIIESNEPERRRVIDKHTAFLMTSMLQSVVTYGTGWRAKALNRPVAGKTGTTNEYRDAWFLGYTTDMVTGVWVGFDNAKPLGPEETGSRSAAPIWVNYMKQVMMGNEPRNFPVPGGITTRLIDSANGLLANEWTQNTLEEYFKEGTEPLQYSPSIWETNEPDALFFNRR